MSSSDKSHPEIGKFQEIEIQKVFDAILSSQNLRVQLGVYFGTISLALIGVAFTTQKAGLFFFVGVVFLVQLLRDRSAYITWLKLLLRAVQLSDKYSEGDDTNFLLLPMTERYEKRIRTIASIKDHVDQQNVLKSLWYRFPSTTGFWWPLLASIINFILGALFFLAFGWSLF